MIRKSLSALVVSAAIITPALFAGNASAASPDEDRRATENFNATLGTAMTVGGLAGTGTGAVIGCVVGATATVPALGVGCVPGAVAGAGIGGVVGTLAFGGGALALAGADAVQTYTAAPGSTRWAQAPQ